MTYSIAAYTHLTIGLALVIVGILIAVLFVMALLNRIQNHMLDEETNRAISKFARCTKNTDMELLNAGLHPHIVISDGEIIPMSDMLHIQGSDYTLDGWRKEFTNRSELIVTLITNKYFELAQNNLNELQRTLDNLPFYAGKNTEYRALADIQEMLNNVVE